jgi:hypothetical protein
MVHHPQVGKSKGKTGNGAAPKRAAAVARKSGNRGSGSSHPFSKR